MSGAKGAVMSLPATEKGIFMRLAGESCWMPWDDVADAATEGWRLDGNYYRRHFVAAAKISALHDRISDLAAAASKTDWVKSAIVEGWKQSGLSAYELARRAGGAVSDDHLRRYRDDPAAQMSADKLGAVMRVLGLTITPAK